MKIMTNHKEENRLLSLYSMG
ncbi:GAF domain-containing protein, partial [Klebsiella pneumoniae]